MSITWLSWPNRTEKGKAWGEERWDSFVCCVVSGCIIHLCWGFSCFILGHGLLEQRAKDSFCQDLMTHVISWWETHFQMQLNLSFFYPNVFQNFERGLSPFPKSLLPPVTEGQGRDCYKLFISVPSLPWCVFIISSARTSSYRRRKWV